MPPATRPGRTRTPTHDYHEGIDPVLEPLRRRTRVFMIDASRDPGTVQAEIPPAGT
jgi:hypothetical protein